MLPLGTPAPDFSLPECDGGTVRLSDVLGKKALLVIFMCNHCPYVKHVAEQLQLLTDHYMPLGVSVVAINSNDADAYPDDSPEAMAQEKAQRGYGFPYLYDADQQVARAYAAACTPDFFLFDGDGKLVYRGQLDASRPKTEIPVTGSDLRAAIDAVLSGAAPSAEQRASLGCNIKWKSGNEPEYFNAAGVS